MFETLNNYRNTVKEGIDTSYMDFAPLKNFCGKKINVDGFFFNESKYGKQVVVVGNGYLINMPKRAVEQFEQIEKTPEMLDALLEGHLRLEKIMMIDTKNGTTVSYEFKDC